MINLIIKILLIGIFWTVFFFILILKLFFNCFQSLPWLLILSPILISGILFILLLSFYLIQSGINHIKGIDE